MFLIKFYLNVIQRQIALLTILYKLKIQELLTRKMLKIIKILRLILKTRLALTILIYFWLNVKVRLGYIIKFKYHLINFK